MENVYLEELKKLINYFIEVSGSIVGKKIKGHESIKYSEAIAQKTISHICSSYSLYGGIKLLLANGNYVDFIDNSSIAVLTRAALESYLTFNHIFISSGSKEERIFRFNCWDLSGFIERQNYNATTEYNKRKKEEEARYIIVLLSEIRKDTLFKKFTVKQQTQIEKGKWKLNYGWTDLANNAGFDKMFFKETYSHLCDYAHTGRVSALQIMQAESIDKQRKLAKPFMGYGLIILSKFLIDYVQLIPELKSSFDTNIEGKKIALLWKEIGENLKKK